MDSSLSVVTDDGDISWSDSHSLDSDDSNSMIMPVSPSWMGPMATNSHAVAPPSATMTFSHNGQLSPISTEMDGAVSRADNTCEGVAPSHDVVPLMDAGGSSASSVDSWSMGQDESDGLPTMSREGGESDFPWEHELDDEMMVPKLEPLDEEENFCLTDIQEAPLTPVADKTSSAPTQAKPKRPRGRPRKHPLNPVVSANKVTKGRSKTGCLTCRKRKKKCDEAKPRCMNCEKNAVVCEGYPEKQIWKSGRERAEEERLKSHNVPSITLQPLFHGLETIEDRIFWKHYNEHLSAVLTVEGEHKNAFRDMIVTIAVKHEGLMHSILALSSKHIDYDTPYGAKILSSADTTLDALQERSDFHHECAVQKLIPNLDKPIDKSDPEFKTKLCARYAQILCLLLEALVDGNPRGDHRIYLGLYQNLLVAQPPPPEDPAFRAFVTEFFQYHIFADELIRHPDKERGKPRLASETWEPSAPIHPPRLLGVADGLFNYLAQITSIRDTIRANMAEQNDPVVDYTSLYKAVDIEAGIKDWKPEWPRGDSRDRVSLLYAQMTWLYLLRTIKPPASSSHPTSLSSSSTSLPATAMPTTIAIATLGSPASAATNTPPLSSSSASDSSSPHLPHRPWPPTEDQQPPNLSESHHHHHHHHQPQPSLHHLPPSGSSGDDDTNDADMEQQEEEEEEEAVLDHARRHSHAHADSPPPIRLPPGQDHRISVAVEESLAILEGFKPADPAQTLLLMPCLVIGTVCFAPHQRARVRAAVRVVRGYRGLRNADRVSELLEEVWRAMDRGDWMAVWDWQGVARGMGLDFLCS